MAPLSMQNATAAISCTPITARDGTVLCSWANNPGTRGTLNIIWLCVSTLGLCVWNAVHPDVPYPGTPKWRVVGTRIWWLFIGLLMPEILVLTALAQFRQAYVLLVRISRETRVPTQFPWWMRVIERLRPTPPRAHDNRRAPSLRVSEVAAPSPNVELEDMTTLLPIRAAEASLPVAPPLAKTSETPGVEDGVPECTRKHPWTLTHSFYAVMRGFLGEDGDAFWTTTEYPNDHDRATFFDADKGIQRIAAAFDDPLSIPDISADDLEDRSKADALAKALLVWQFSVFIANCAARWNQNIPLSLLEITTLAHSLCSLVALGLWWYKPHSVTEAVVIDRTRSLPPLRTGSWLFRAWEKVLPGTDHMDITRSATILGIAVLYGLPHLLGLSAHFLTSAEQLCWKIATLAVICLPLIMCVIVWIIDHVKRVFDRMNEALAIASLGSLGWLIQILVFLYVTSSMFLVGESVHQVFALPEGSFYEPQLTRYLPSFS